MATTETTPENKCGGECGGIGTVASAGGDAKWRRLYGKQHDGFLKELKIEFPYDPAILLLGIQSEEWKAESQRDVCTPMLPAALVPIAKKVEANQMFIDRQINKPNVVSTCNGILSTLKKGKNFRHSLQH